MIGALSNDIYYIIREDPATIEICIKMLVNSSL